MKNLQRSSVFWSQRAIAANGDGPSFRSAAAAEGRARGLGRLPGSLVRLMKILIVLTSRSTVNNKILISAYWIAFFSYVGVPKKFIVINVSQKFIA